MLLVRSVAGILQHFQPLVRPSRPLFMRCQLKQEASLPAAGAFF